MGVSYYPRLVIGATLSPNDLMKTTSGEVVCPKGHPPQGGPFCSECGAKMEPQLVRSFNPAFVKFAKNQFENPSPDDLFDEWTDSDCIFDNVYVQENPDGAVRIDPRDVGVVDGKVLSHRPHTPGT